ncbi:MAG: hypothetical protein Q4G35_09235 [Propionibacteriaceae bacterium]|nr:hypothetical protein [Propionibacteriaceae bacterium]
MTHHLRPRTAVLGDVWRELRIDAPALVNKDGVPLARAVKCLVDPLVVRPRTHRNLGQALLGDADAQQLHRLLDEARTHLEDASRWYELLRAQRKALGISEGNPQELYFPRAYELAVTVGSPEADAEQRAAETLAEVHDQSQPGLDELLSILEESEVRSAVERTINQAFVDGAVAPDLGQLATLLWAALEEPDGERLAALLPTREVADLALAMRHEAGLLRALLAVGGRPGASVALSVADPLKPPSYTGQGTLPLDRSFEQRARAALRRHREQFTSVTPEEILEDEMDRACAGFGLHSDEARALFAAGILVAASLTPLATEGVEPIHRPRVVADLQARIRKEAYVMHLRRELAGGGAIHPEQRRVVDELKQFWRPWLNRLWVRLHGRDVTQSPNDDGSELLTGITRSVMLDHRQQIRGALERLAA